MMACNPLQAFFKCSDNFRFCRSCKYFCALSLLLLFTRFHYGEYLYIQLYICEYTVFFTVLQLFLGSLSTLFVNVLHWGSPSTPRSPAFSRGFVYTFGGGLKRGGALHVGVRSLHFLFHLLSNTFSTYYTQFSF